MLSLNGCTYCKKSAGSKMIYDFLKSNNIVFEDEVPCEGDNSKYFYDYKVKYRGKIYIIEYDGGGHFRKVDYWHKTDEQFENAQIRDIRKQLLALKEGWRIIRIDHTVDNREIEKELIKAFAQNEQTYYTNPCMYDWLDEGVRNLLRQEK